MYFSFSSQNSLMIRTFQFFLGSSPALCTFSVVCATFSDNMSPTHYPLVVPSTLVKLRTFPEVLSLLAYIIQIIATLQDCWKRARETGIQLSMEVTFAIR